MNNNQSEQSIPLKSSHSLSNLAKQLKSERDRQRYIKVIEMSQIIQSKLEHINNNNSTLASRKKKKTRLNSIIRPVDDDDGNDDDIEYLDDDDSILFLDDKKKYNTYSGRSFRTLDKKTSIQFLQREPVLYHKRASVDTIWVDLCMDQDDKKKQIIYMKPKKRQSSITNKQVWCDETLVTSSPPTPSPDNNESESESEEEGSPRTIHIAVRRNASLFTIEKTPKKSNKKDSKINHRKVIYCSPPALPEEETTIPIAPPKRSITEKESQQDIPSLASDQKTFSSAGLLTPPHSPQGHQPQVIKLDDNDNTNFMDLPVIHVQKKAHQSLKGFITRSYQLNHLTVTRTSTSSNFYKAIDNKNHSSIKYLLKALIRSLGPNEPEQQRRFGFSFVWQKPQLEESISRQHDDAKFAIAPDSLVKEALMTWITFLNEGEEGFVPCLLKADNILRDGRKLYVVYDSHLF
ncbi:hypothetical protein K501DRAFT_328710 [Backusella circina FSU 941]|nr:hypothetical protein K501DRAFT_328710 [Backusella circina FSU 941]